MSGVTRVAGRVIETGVESTACMFGTRTSTAENW